MTPEEADKDPHVLLGRLIDYATELAKLATAKSAPPEAARIPVLPCELVVGAGRFGSGVSVSTVQGAIDRLYERMRLMESRLGELCYSCKLGIFHLDKSHQINLAPDAASGGTVVWVHDDCDKSAAKTFFPKRETIPSPQLRSQEEK